MDNLILKLCKCGGVPELLFNTVQNTYYKPYVQCSACKEKVEHPSHVSWGYKNIADLIVCDKWNSAEKLLNEEKCGCQNSEPSFIGKIVICKKSKKLLATVGLNEGQIDNGIYNITKN